MKEIMQTYGAMIVAVVVGIALLTGKCGTLDQYFFGCSIKKHGSKHEYQRTEQQICNKKPAFQTDS